MVKSFPELTVYPKYTIVLHYTKKNHDENAMQPSETPILCDDDDDGDSSSSSSSNNNNNNNNNYKIGLCQMKEPFFRHAYKN